MPLPPPPKAIETPNDYVALRCSNRRRRRRRRSRRHHFKVQFLLFWFLVLTTVLKFACSIARQLIKINRHVYAWYWNKKSLFLAATTCCHSLLYIHTCINILLVERWKRKSSTFYLKFILIQQVNVFFIIKKWWWWFFNFFMF